MTKLSITSIFLIFILFGCDQGNNDIQLLSEEKTFPDHGETLEGARSMSTTSNDPGPELSVSRYQRFLNVEWPHIDGVHLYEVRFGDSGGELNSTIIHVDQTDPQDTYDHNSNSCLDHEERYQFEVIARTIGFGSDLYYGRSIIDAMTTPTKPVLWRIGATICKGLRPNTIGLGIRFKAAEYESCSVAFRFNIQRWNQYTGEYSEGFTVTETSRTYQAQCVYFHVNDRARVQVVYDDGSESLWSDWLYYCEDANCL